MPVAKKQNAAHKHDDLLKEIAALKKEVAALKKQCDQCCAKQAKGGGGADPRVDKVLEALKNYSPKLAKALS